ncbi:hypothetical protein [Streptomyces sp. NBC_01565]|uniref:hypothetical protein n=1 Tax=unclassified Streptomyces TaxID=2593676 RepID=UPI002257022E|nr:hypothetical protein [Streptomyces sp. NBC_01565]MCX4546539.1 hypothetical protein [Streptomyces sp. NBC_01565]
MAHTPNSTGSGPNPTCGRRALFRSGLPRARRALLACLRIVALSAASGAAEALVGRLLQH